MLDYALKLNINKFLISNGTTKMTTTLFDYAPFFLHKIINFFSITFRYFLSLLTIFFKKKKLLRYKFMWFYIYFKFSILSGCIIHKNFCLYFLIALINFKAIPLNTNGQCYKASIISNSHHWAKMFTAPLEKIICNLIISLY